MRTIRTLSRAIVLFLIGTAGIFTVLSIASCSTTDSDRPLVTDGHVSPGWYDEPKTANTKSTTAFAGKGVGSTKRQAELLSYSDLCSTISKYTGSELGEIDYRELSTKGTIEEYGLSIKKTFTTFNGSTYAYYVLASCSNEELASHRSADVVAYYDRIEGISDSISTGDGCMMAGNYVGAIENYIDSLCLSYGFDYVDSEYSFDSIYSEVESLLEIMYFAPDNRLALLKKRAEGYSMVLKINEGVIPSTIPESRIKVTYSVTDVRGNPYLEQYVMYTDSNGRFSFNPEDYGVYAGSRISFSLDLDDSLSKLKKVNSSAAGKLEELVNGITYTVEYGKTYSMGSLIIVGFDYRANGELIEDSISTGYFKTQFESNNAVIRTVDFPEDITDEELIEKFKADNKDCRYILIVRTGVTDRIASSTGSCIAFAEGKAVLYRVSDSNAVFETDIVNGSGMGSGEDEAGEQALIMVCEILYNLIRTKYV